MRYLGIDTAKKISKIGLGTWQFGSSEWGYGNRYAEREAPAIVLRALELGVTLFDTAEIYGFGSSERMLGEALGGSLDSVFLTTKIMPVVPVAPWSSSGRWPARTGLGPTGSICTRAPAQSAGPRPDDHARHACAAEDRADR
jgi:aryl-alcohol dehydrogenase-like predicted oxidoreductase